MSDYRKHKRGGWTFAHPWPETQRALPNGLILERVSAQRGAARCVRWGLFDLDGTLLAAYVFESDAREAALIHTKVNLKVYGDE